jgi:uncharacterized glyoxalase superfamily protein PhnB
VLASAAGGQPEAKGERQMSVKKTSMKKTSMKKTSVKKITAVLFAPEIEPCLKFWVERFGFEKTLEVPEGNKLAFAIVQKGGVELMYQSYASADKDAPAEIAQAVRKGPTFLYVEVDNLDETIAALKGVDVVMPVRTTFYGAREIGVKDPAGHFVTFAQMSTAPQN